jgi:GNAT superfamily N-acetyltransferase
MTPPPIVLTRELAERIEHSVPAGKLRTYGGIEPARFGRRTIALRGATPQRQWLNGVYCFGDEDVDCLPQILASYRATGAALPSFYLAPTHFTQAVGEALRGAGNFQAGFAQAMFYGTPAIGDDDAGERITVHPVTKDKARAFAETVARGFVWPDEWREAAKAGMEQRVGTDGFHAYLARYRGELAGAGAIDVIDNAACLVHGAVVPPCRRNGVHLALLRHRLRAAHELGCDLVIGGADFGSGSFRNQLRAGLSVAYVESAWEAAA